VLTPNGDVPNKLWEETQSLQKVSRFRVQLQHQALDAPEAPPGTEK
jgi:hypothetical protein